MPDPNRRNGTGPDPTERPPDASPTPTSRRGSLPGGANGHAGHRAWRPRWRAWPCSGRRGCGSTAVLEAIEKHLGIKAGHTTPDKLFTVINNEEMIAVVHVPEKEIGTLKKGQKAFITTRVR